MVAAIVIMSFIIGGFIGFGFAATVFTKVKTEEVVRRAGVSAKQLKKRMMLLRESMNLIHQFLNPTDLEGGLDYLSEPSRVRAEKLLNEYNEEVK